MVNLIRPLKMTFVWKKFSDIQKETQFLNKLKFYKSYYFSQSSIMSKMQIWDVFERKVMFSERKFVIPCFINDFIP